MNTADFIQPFQERVLNDFGFEITNNRHFDCPLCQAKKKARLNWYNGNIAFICTCESLSLLSFLCAVTGKEFGVLAGEIDRDYGNTTGGEFKPKPANKKLIRAKEVFLAANPIQGSDGEVYLHSREIYNLPKSELVFGEIWDHEQSRKIPAMIAAARDHLGKPLVLHVTYIENGKKLTCGTQRKMHKLQGDGPCAIKLFEPTDILGIGEGIESCLSAYGLYKIPTWSAMNATFLKKFKAPTGVKHLFIFADNDANGTGLEAAFTCGRANILANNEVQKVTIYWPEKLNDFNDVAVDGDKVLQWQLTKT